MSGAHASAALVRALPSTFAAQALRADGKVVINQGLAQAQHKEYVETLRRIVGKVICLPAMDSLADSVFVEDTVVVVPNTSSSSRLAIGITMGHASRRAEAESVLQALRDNAQFKILTGQRGTLDGGDVLWTGKSFLVGIGARTNQLGFEQFRELVPEHIRVESIALRNPATVLHLKSVCTMFGPNALVVFDNNTGAVSLSELQHKTGVKDLFTVPEMGAANCLWLNQHLVLRADCSQTSRDILQRKAAQHGFPASHLHWLDYSEMAKADAALTCCSVLF